MQDNCRKTIKNMACGAPLEVNTQAPNVYPAFSVCLPFGRALEWDGSGLRLKGKVTLPNGNYGVITVEDGCITDAQEQPVCEYTPQPCSPAASGCSGSTSGSSSSLVLQPSADNLLNYDASGRLGAELNYVASDGINITGNGTSSNPLVISSIPTEATQTHLVSGNAGVSVTGDGGSSTPYVVTHIDGRLSGGVYGSFTIDDFGHITDYTPQTEYISGVVAGHGIDVTTTGTLVTVSTKYHDVKGTYLLGGVSCEFDETGALNSVAETITIPVDKDTQQISLLGRDYTYTFNSYGSLIGYAYTPDNSVNQFVEILKPNRDYTTITIVTTKAAYFKITYKGAITQTASSTVKSYTALMAPMSVLINNREYAAYGIYNGNVITDILCVPDALFSAGQYTIHIYNNTDDYKYTDTGVLTVELAQRGS